MPVLAKKAANAGPHVVLAYIARTEDAIYSNIVYSACRVLGRSQAACDLRKKPSEIFSSVQIWMTRAQDIAQDLRGTYPGLKLTNTESKPYFDKKLEAFCDLLLSKIIGRA